ncbi:hypothetical protein CYMTET_32638, partial [Cymbomonas tetramitiformis]
VDLSDFDVNAALAAGSALRFNSVFRGLRLCARLDGRPDSACEELRGKLRGLALMLRHNVALLELEVEVTLGKDATLERRNSVLASVDSVVEALAGNPGLVLPYICLAPLSSTGIRDLARVVAAMPFNTLQQLRLSDCANADHASCRELLEALQKHSRSLTQLDLPGLGLMPVASSCHLSTFVEDPLGPYWQTTLAGLVAVQDVNLRCATDGAVAAAAAPPAVVNIDLSGTVFRGPRGLMALTQHLRGRAAAGSPVRVVRMRGCLGSLQDVLEGAAATGVTLDFSEDPQDRTVSTDQHEEVAALALSSTFPVSGLRLTAAGIGERGVIAALEASKLSPELKTLELSRNVFSGKDLEFFFNRPEDQRVSPYSKIKNNYTVHQQGYLDRGILLESWVERFMATDADAFRAFVRVPQNFIQWFRCDSLYSPSQSSSQGFPAPNVEAVSGEAASKKVLEVLIDSDCALTSLGIAGGGRMATSRDPRDARLGSALLKPLLFGLGLNTSLTSLDISGNWVGPGIGAMLGAALRRNRTLTALNWDRNGITMHDLKAFRGCLYGNKKLRDVPCLDSDLDNLLQEMGLEIGNGEDKKDVKRKINTFWKEKTKLQDLAMTVQQCIVDNKQAAAVKALELNIKRTLQQAAKATAGANKAELKEAAVIAASKDKVWVARRDAYTAWKEHAAKAAARGVDSAWFHTFAVYWGKYHLSPKVAADLWAAVPVALQPEFVSTKEKVDRLLARELRVQEQVAILRKTALELRAAAQASTAKADFLQKTVLPELKLEKIDIRNELEALPDVGWSWIPLAPTCDADGVPIAMPVTGDKNVSLSPEGSECAAPPTAPAVTAPILQEAASQAAHGILYGHTATTDTRTKKVVKQQAKMYKRNKKNAQKSANKKTTTDNNVFEELFDLFYDEEHELSLVNVSHQVTDTDTADADSAEEEAAAAAEAEEEDAAAVEAGDDDAYGTASEAGDDLITDDSEAVAMYGSAGPRDLPGSRQPPSGSPGALRSKGRCLEAFEELAQRTHHLAHKDATAVRTPSDDGAAIRTPFDASTAIKTPFDVKQWFDRKWARVMQDVEARVHGVTKPLPMRVAPYGGLCAAVRPSSEEITLVTQCSVDRFARLQARRPTADHPRKRDEERVQSASVLSSANLTVEPRFWPADDG